MSVGGFVPEIWLRDNALNAVLLCLPQEKAGCKMQMIQDGPYANTPEKPLRMTGGAENCKVR